MVDYRISREKTKFQDSSSGPMRGGSGGTSYPGQGIWGPGLRGPVRVEIVTSSWGPNFFLPCPLFIPDFGKIKGPNLSEDLFLFLLFTQFRGKKGPNLSEDLF